LMDEAARVSGIDRVELRRKKFHQARTNALQKSNGPGL